MIVLFLCIQFHQDQACIYVKDLMEDIPDDVDIQNSPGNANTVKPVISGQPKYLVKCGRLES